MLLNYEGVNPTTLGLTLKLPRHLRFLFSTDLEVSLPGLISIVMCSHAQMNSRNETSSL